MLHDDIIYLPCWGGGCAAVYHNIIMLHDDKLYRACVCVWGGGGGYAPKERVLGPTGNRTWENQVK